MRVMNALSLVEMWLVLIALYGVNHATDYPRLMTRLMTAVVTIAQTVASIASVAIVPIRVMITSLKMSHGVSIATRITHSIVSLVALVTAIEVTTIM
jgi:hypothetical protein